MPCVGTRARSIPGEPFTFWEIDLDTLSHSDSEAVPKAILSSTPESNPTFFAKLPRGMAVETDNKARCLTRSEPVFRIFIVLIFTCFFLPPLYDTQKTRTFNNQMYRFLVKLYFVFILIGFGKILPIPTGTTFRGMALSVAERKRGILEEQARERMLAGKAIDPPLNLAEGTRGEVRDQLAERKRTILEEQARERQGKRTDLGNTNIVPNLAQCETPSRVRDQNTAPEEHRRTRRRSPFSVSSTQAPRKAIGAPKRRRPCFP